MLFLALRHLISRKKQTLITLLGVGLGCAVFITFGGIMTGFQNYIIDQLVNNDAHVHIQSEDKSLDPIQLKKDLWPQDPVPLVWLNKPQSSNSSSHIQNPLGWFYKLDQDPRVFAYTPQIQAQVIFSRSGISISGRISGIIVDSQQKVSNISHFTTEGKFSSIGSSGSHLVLGDGLAQKLGVSLSNTVYVSTGISQPSPFKVTALFHTGIKNIDDAVGFAHINDVQQVSGRANQITDIAIKLFDVDQSQNFARQYSELSTEKVLSWDQANANILSVFAFQDLIRSFISATIMIVAAFGIYNILNIVVNQKRKDIGILRSMGFDQFEIVELFMIQGVILGFCGGIIGMILGFGLSHIFMLFKVSGMVDRIVVNFSPKLYILGFVISLVASVVSSILPARSAGKLRPIDIVRSGE